MSTQGTLSLSPLLRYHLLCMLDTSQVLYCNRQRSLQLRIGSKTQTPTSDPHLTLVFREPEPTPLMSSIFKTTRYHLSLRFQGRSQPNPPLLPLQSQLQKLTKRGQAQRTSKEEASQQQCPVNPHHPHFFNQQRTLPQQLEYKSLESEHQDSEISHGVPNPTAHRVVSQLFSPSADERWR
jgi:hypothetical protein